MNKSVIYDYINEYPNVDVDKIKLDWNGKRGLAFHDKSQTFRGNVIVKVMEGPNRMHAKLIRELVVQEASWSAKSLSYRYYLTDMVEWLLVNDFEASCETIVKSFDNNHAASKCLHDLSLDDKKITSIIGNIERLSKMNPTVMGYAKLIEELKKALALREDSMKQKEAFEKYVTDRDKVHVAAKKNLMTFLKEGEMTFIALFILIPCTLAIGYYFFGMNILIGMIPMALALIVIYMIFMIVKFIIR